MLKAEDSSHDKSLEEVRKDFKRVMKVIKEFLQKTDTEIKTLLKEVFVEELKKISREPDEIDFS